MVQVGTRTFLASFTCTCYLIAGFPSHVYQQVNLSREPSVDMAAIADPEDELPATQADPAASDSEDEDDDQCDLVQVVSWRHHRTRKSKLAGW